MCTAYGPQEYAPNNQKKLFWEYLEKDGREAASKGDSWFCQMDSNFWAGDSLIPEDPNKQNSNGKLLQEFLERNPNLILLNGKSICSGVITRRRLRLGKEERSVLDLVIISQDLMENVEKMTIDEEDENHLTNYKIATNGKGAKDSDHHSTEVDMKFKMGNIPKIRKMFLHYKDPGALKKYTGVNILL